MQGVKVEIDPIWLREQYVDKSRSYQDIASELGCNSETVRLRAKSLGIKSRGTSEASAFNINEDWLREQYELKERSFRDIAKEVGCDSATVIRYAKMVGIQSRSHGEAIQGDKHPFYGKHLSKEHREKLGGENHPCWKGGISFEPYCHKFNNALKESIRDEFGRECYICGAKENGIRLHIHHVDYNKNTLCNGKTWGLVPLCQSCHAKTNWDRWYWFGLLGNYWLLNPATNFRVSSIALCWR